MKNIRAHISALPKDVRNNGENHLIFNHFFGTFPDYSNMSLGFDAGKAMIAWTSAKRQVDLRI